MIEEAISCQLLALTHWPLCGFLTHMNTYHKYAHISVYAHKLTHLDCLFHLPALKEMLVY